MARKYEILFQVELIHEYFTDGRGTRAMSIEPTADCRAALIDFGLLFRKIETGFVVLYEGLEDALQNVEPRRPLSGLPPLRFTLNPSDPVLLQYIALPPASGNGFFYFHNRHGNAGDPFPLSAPSGGGFASAADRATLKDPALTLDLPTAEAAETIHLFGASGESLWSETIAARGNPAVIPVRADLSPYRGQVRLVRSHGDDQIYYVDRDMFRAGAFGVLELFSDTSAPADARFLDAQGAPAPKTFRLSMRKPETLWRYHVIPRDENFDENDARVAGGSPVSFSANPDGVATSGSLTVAGETAHIFESVGPMPLQQVPVKDIELQPKQNEGGSKALIGQLPNPRLDALRYDPNSPNGPFYSDVYVYV